MARTVIGATSLRSHREDSSPERTLKAGDATRGVARWAAKQIRSGETVLLDAGATITALARQLRSARNLTVATTSLDVMQELSEAESIHVECLGERCGMSAEASSAPSPRRRSSA